MKIIAEKFGVTKNQEDVIKYTVEFEKLKIEVLNYGCVIKSIYIPDKNGKMENIVLGFDNLKDYEKDKTPYFGSVVGRIAGRTKNGILEIKGYKYQLTQNDGNSNLHGGLKGLHNRVWESNCEIKDEKAILTFKTTSPHLEEGFPGKVDFTVKYIIDGKSISLEYTGIPDRDTYMNLTNHVYFNLSGDFKEKIDNQKMKFNAIGYYSVDKETLPIQLVEEDEIFKKGEELTLNSALKSAHAQIDIVGGGYDHPFVLSKTEEIDGYVSDEISGRRLEFVTDQAIVVLYTGNYLAGVSNYPKHGGFCLETQDYPDINNIIPEKMKIYSPLNIYTQKTSYIFSK